MESIPLDVAFGRVLAADVAAPEDVPPFRRSRVDGYAVIAADVAGASAAAPARLTLVGDVNMGRPAPRSLARGQTMRIPTGGALPPGADGVAMMEDASVVCDIVEVRDAFECETNVTAAGADVRAGARLFQSGTVLRAPALGLLAACGLAGVDVYRRPAVGLLLTGDELVAPGEPLAPGQIRDVNRYALSAAIWAAGFAPVPYPKVPDDRQAFSAALTRALGECDAVVISGGSSVGERDYTPEVVAAAGAPGVLVHGILAKPGRPTLLGLVADQPIVGLPGNPVSALVMWEAVGKPMCLRMFDKQDKTLPWRAVLDAGIDVDPSYEHRVPVRLLRGDDGLRAQPLVGTSAQMHILAFADAVVIVPLGTRHVGAGALVDAWPLSSALR